MTVKDHIKILDNKIRQNQTDYDLYRKNADISAPSSGELNKYEYLTNKDLGYKPDPIQKAKFKYSPWGQVFHKGLEKDEKQKGLLKRLKIIEDKTDNQLKESKDNQSGIKFIAVDIKLKNLSPEGIEASNKLVEKEKSINYSYLYMKPTPKQEHSFIEFKPMVSLFRTTYYGDMRIPAIERSQNIFERKIERLKKYTPGTEINIDDKDKVLKNAENLYEGRKIIIDAFKNKLFPLASGNYYEEFREESPSSSPTPEREDKEESEGEKIRKENNRQIDELDKHGSALINKYFKEKSLMTIVNNLRNYRKNLPETQQKYQNLMVNLIVGLNKLSKDIDNTPKMKGKI